ncbi:hypothetical protein [Clostridium sp. Marseille-Q2269]|uniref:hypothetical protein n=1 Tax=Clostridium sp. Marseille-Q2269 TaxID=2942205 RepID=UPI0020749E57|nr:hypothetical protein [Clostridium sp. Marseille-Q2269]
MENIKNINPIRLIIFVIIIVMGISLYKNSFFYIGSNNYLSTVQDAERSVYFKRNERDSLDGKKFDFGKFTGKWSLLEFTSYKDNRIVIEDKTRISKGSLYLVVLDSDYNIIAKRNEREENNDISFTTPKSGKYIIKIVGKNLTGNFNIKIKANDNIVIKHIDFFK